MSQKKDLRNDNTYLIGNDSTDNPKLGAKVLSDGRESLFLDFYLGFEKAVSREGKEYSKAIRRREYMGLYLWQAPRTPLERQQNKDTLEIAKKVKFEKGQELLESVEGYRLKRHRDIDFIGYFESYIANYKKKDIRVVRLALRRFREFLKETPEYNNYMGRIKPDQITKDMVEDFTDYLRSRSRGEGAKTLYGRFKKVVNYAVEHDIFLKNPCKGVTIKVDETILKKDVLSLDDVGRLAETHYKGENQEVRRAFIFCLYCGLRYCDVRELTYNNIDYSNKILRFEQSKTRGHSGGSGVVIPLNEGLMAIIGEPNDPGKREERIFKLPTATGCTKQLAHWVEAAGINKHITWHCARHSFAVNLLNNGANIKTVASLLGHSGLRCTEKYTRAVDSLKKEAIDSLGKIKF